MRLVIETCAMRPSTALEIVSARDGARSVTLRLVEIPPEEPGETRREAHHRAGFEECAFVLLCYFPVADIVSGTEEPGMPPGGQSS